MEIIGFLASVLIGVVLGLIGGGGSILTVPVLVYLFGLDAIVATSYSLFIVGLTSLVGTGSYWRQGLINMRAAIVFGIPSVIAVFVARAYLLPMIPNELGTIGDWVLTKNTALLLLFALLMIMAALGMIRKGPKTTVESQSDKKFNYPLILLEGIIVGTLTGLVGAGGGFLIIPALVVLSKLPIKEAIGTSLLIIAIKSFIGFWGEPNLSAVNWTFLISVSIFAILGIFIGTYLSKRIDGKVLKPVFGWFVLLMGIFIFLKESGI